MQKPPPRSIADILDAYRDYLLSKVSKVRILGEADERELKDVFVELSIVEQRTLRQHAEFLSMMDSAMRRRFDPFADEDTDTKSETSESREKETKRRVKPDDLLRRRAKAIVTGAPGCGKTTLLKYLALKAQEEKKRLAVWLELKAIDKPLFTQAERVAAHVGTLILPEIWLKHLKAQLSLSDGEIKLMRAYWLERFKANEIAVFLDGFDELQDEASERNLNKCVREFASASHDNTLLISTRPYAQHKLGKERLQELEIEPLNQRRIEAFLNCYYPNDPAIKSLLKNLRERSSLKGLLYIPLLLGVILRLHREDRFTNDRLNLYEAIIADLVCELDRSKSVARRFKINDERLRLDFLKFLAFERLLRDPLDDEGKELSRLIFGYELLKEKAGAFLAQEHSSYHPRDLADDALATPLLREVGVDTFAFTHLSLQEYLAARAFAAFYRSNEFEGLKIFCRAYHNPTIVEMEVLPMMLGATANAGKLYTEIDRWPESLTFAGVRLRARGLAYSAKIRQGNLSKLIDCLLGFIGSPWDRHTMPYRELVVNSFAGVNRQVMSFIESKAESLTKPDAWYFFEVAEALGQIGSDKAIDALVSKLNELDMYAARQAIEVLGFIGSDKAVDALISVLNDVPHLLHYEVAKAAEDLGRLGSDKAVGALISALNHESSDVRQHVALALGEIGSDKAVDALTATLNDKDDLVRLSAAVALGMLGSDKAVDILISALSDEDRRLRSNAAYVIRDVGSDKLVDALARASNDEDSSVRWGAINALGRFDSDQAIDALTAALKDEDAKVRSHAVYGLERFGSDRAADALIFALNNEKGGIRHVVAGILGRVGTEKAVDALISVLNDEDDSVRRSASSALVEIGSDKAIDGLISALNDDGDVRRRATEASGDIRADKAVGALIAALNREGSTDVWTATRVLAKMKAEALTSGLVRTINKGDDLDRKKAISIIGYYSNDKRTLDQLKQSAQTDKNSKVRKAAKEAAEKFARKLELLGHSICDDAGRPSGDNESRELFLVGEAFKVAAEAGHIFRPIPNSDWGIDGEIEFKDERSEASGRRVYLQLKSGDSYLRKRKSDGKEIFTIKNPRHAEYWQSHAYPVLLVIRDSSGQIRWMNVTEYLQRHGASIKQIEFQGEPFTAESVKQMRARFFR